MSLSILLYMLVFCLIAVISLLFLLMRAKSRQIFLSEENEKMMEILSTVPSGYFYFLYKPQIEVCSRRLAVLLGIYEKRISYATILDHLSDKSRTLLDKKLEELQVKGREFSVILKDKNEVLRLMVKGTRSSDVDGHTFADILWFSDVTDILSQSELNEQKAEAYQKQSSLFLTALDGLPYAVWMRNSDMSLGYCNLEYLKLAGVDNRKRVLDESIELSDCSKNKVNPKILAIAAKNTGEIQSHNAVFVQDKTPKLYELSEIPLNTDKDVDNRYTIGFAKSVQQTEELKQSLENYVSAQHEVLAGLESAIAIFKADGHLDFYNPAFSQIWKLENDWLDTKPSYGAILDRLREKRLLPEAADFIRFKHDELNVFSTLTTSKEDMMHLPSGQILKRFVMPYPLGGIVMTFDDVTDRVSLERSFNEQLEIQKSMINHMPQGTLFFDNVGRLKAYNPAYVSLFKPDEDFLRSEPLLMEFIDSQKPVLCASDDVWPLLKDKILIAIEDSHIVARLKIDDKITVVFKSVHLPNGGLLLSYERDN